MDVWWCYSHLSLFQHGRSEISACVQVGIQGKTAMGTNKRTARTRTQLSAFGADFGSIAGLDLNKFNSLSICLILDETLQLEEAPIANPVVNSFSPSDFPDSLEVFHYYPVSIELGNDCLADVMICPSHKPLLSSRKLFEKPSGASSAFALEFASQEFEFPFNLLYFGGVKKLPVGSDCEIINSQVHTESSVRTRTIGAFLGEREQEEASSLGINPQEAFINFPAEILLVAIGDGEWNFDSSLDCGNAQNIVLEGETPWRIISYGTEFNDGLGLGFLYEPAGLPDAGNSELALQSHIPQISIDKRMELDVISDAHIPSPVNAQLHPFFVDSESIDNLLPWFDSNFGCCSGSHNIYKDINYLNLTEGAIPPKLKSLGILANFI